MIRYSLILSCALALAACSGSNPFDDAASGGGSGAGGIGGGGGQGIDTGDTGGDGSSIEPPGTGSDEIIAGDLPPGTENPRPNRNLIRREPRGPAESAYSGNGFANSVSYDGDTDTFNVVGLPFDGTQPEGDRWSRAGVSTLGPSGGAGFAVYEAPFIVGDILTDFDINQFYHRAIYGVNRHGEGQFAVVRTGNYDGYGFGGFVYQRNGGVVLPTVTNTVTGQARYSGAYAGLRDYQGREGMEYTTGQMRVDIDMGAFMNNCDTPRCEDAIRGTVSERRVFTMAGADVTQEIIDAINAEYVVSMTSLPNLKFVIQPGVMNLNGEATGGVTSGSINARTYEDGKYYLVLAGDHSTLGDDPANPKGGSIVGIVVVEAPDPRNSQITVRETGGFIVDRAEP